MLPGTDALKVSWHGQGAAADADHVNRRTDGADAATFLPALPHLLPQAAGPVADMRTCLYTNSPDHHFIIDRHPKDERVVVACGFSGHGFKFASVIGELLADLSGTGESRVPARFLSLARR